MVLAALVGAPLGASIGILVSDRYEVASEVPSTSYDLYFRSWRPKYIPNRIYASTRRSSVHLEQLFSAIPSYAANTDSLMHPIFAYFLQAGSFIIEKYISRPTSPFLLRCDRSADDDPNIPMPDTAHKPVSFWEKTLLKDTSPALVQPDYERVSNFII